MKNVTVTNLETGNSYTVDEHTTESDMRQSEPLFFKRPHGKRETYTIYRGQIIVRNTVKFTGCQPSRRTTAYLYIKSDTDKNKSWLFCVSVGCNPELSSVFQAKHLIDKILNYGQYQFNMSL